MQIQRAQTVEIVVQDQEQLLLKARQEQCCHLLFTFYLAPTVLRTFSFWGNDWALDVEDRLLLFLFIYLVRMFLLFLRAEFYVQSDFTSKINPQNIRFVSAVCVRRPAVSSNVFM